MTTPDTKIETTNSSMLGQAGSFLIAGDLAHEAVRTAARRGPILAMVGKSLRATGADRKPVSVVYTVREELSPTVQK